MSHDKIILGIDPGTTVMGYGLIHIEQNKLKLLNFGVIQLHKLSNHPDKLKRILERLNGLIAEYKPDEMAIEAPFFGKNVQSMLKLGRAQGVAIAAALNHNMPFEEYSPRRVKQAITGSGSASKEQVAASCKNCSTFLKCQSISMPQMVWVLPFAIISPKESANTTKLKEIPGPHFYHKTQAG